MIAARPTPIGSPACSSADARPRIACGVDSASSAWPTAHSPPTPRPVSSLNPRTDQNPVAKPVSPVPSEYSEDRPRHHVAPAEPVGEVAEQDAADARSAQRHAQQRGLLPGVSREVVADGNEEKGEEDQVVEVEHPAGERDEPDADWKPGRRRDGWHAPTIIAAAPTSASGSPLDDGPRKPPGARRSPDDVLLGCVVQAGTRGVTAEAQALAACRAGTERAPGLAALSVDGGWTVAHRGSPRV